MSNPSDLMRVLKIWIASVEDDDDEEDDAFTSVASDELSS